MKINSFNNNKKHPSTFEVPFFPPAKAQQKASNVKNRKLCFNRPVCLVHENFDPCPRKWFTTLILINNDQYYQLYTLINKTNAQLIYTSCHTLKAADPVTEAELWQYVKLNGCYEYKLALETNILGKLQFLEDWRTHGVSNENNIHISDCHFNLNSNCYSRLSYLHHSMGGYFFSPVFQEQSPS